MIEVDTIVIISTTEVDHTIVKDLQPVLIYISQESSTFRMCFQRELRKILQFVVFICYIQLFLFGQAIILDFVLYVNCVKFYCKRNGYQRIF